MGRTNQIELQLQTLPEIFCPAVRIPQPNGDILYRPGKPVILDQMIGTSEASKLLGMSHRWVVRECCEGRFKTAFKPSMLARARWKIARTEVLERLRNIPE